MKNRGQMLLIGAVVMAVSFVALGIVLNASFHTETLASEGSSDVHSEQADYIERSIVSDVESLIDEVVEDNRRSPGTQELLINEYINDISRYSESYFAHNDVLVEILPGSPSASVMGTHVEHTGGVFAPSGIQRVVVDGRIRDFKLDSISMTGSGPFTIRFEGSSNTWRVRIEETATGPPQVRVLGGPDSIDEQCTATSRTIDIGEGVIGTGNQHCSALAHLADIEPPYTVWFDGPDRIEGEYEMTVNTGVDPSHPAPKSDRLYGVEATISIEGLQQSTERTMVIAPREIHD